MTPVLEVDAVWKSFPSGFLGRRKPVVRGVSLAVGPGEVFGLLGANGAGKTTTIKLVTALLFPDRGAVRIEGVAATEPRARRGLGFLPENPYLYDDLTGRELLGFHARLAGVPPADRLRRCGELLERLGLAAAADVKLRRWSKGMVQRLGLAQALVGAPRLLVLDEPMSGLDPVGRRDVRDLVLECRDRGMTVFFSSHILQDAEAICERVAILAGGEVRRQGRLADLLGEPRPGYEVEVAGELPEGLRAGAGAVARPGGRTLLRAGSQAEVERLVGALSRAGVRLVSVSPARATLEEVFLREVKGPGAASGEAP